MKRKGIRAVDAKSAAMQDIKADLGKSCKTFIQFRTNLDPVMDELVNSFLENQNKKNG